VTATGGKGDGAIYTGAGIGGGRGAMGTAVYILGGDVTATGGANRYGEVVGPGIGGGVSGNGNGTFATSYGGTAGNATITASSITASTKQSLWSGVINGVRYGAVLSGGMGTATAEEPLADAVSVQASEARADDAEDGDGTALLLAAAGVAGAAGMAGVVWRLYSTGKLGDMVAALGKAGSTALQSAAGSASGTGAAPDTAPADSEIATADAA
jgi:hypothetical protein